MADIGISYSHLDEDLGDRVRQGFIEGGLTVWMDETGDFSADAESVAVPWGQDHWEVIQTEFAAADVVVIVDTPGWHGSAYCQQEFQFLHKWGKWHEVIGAESGDLDEDALGERIESISRLTMERQVVTGAHVRLIHSVRSGDRPGRSLFERLISRQEHRDAASVLASDPQASGVTMTETLTDRANAILAQGRTTRRWLKQAGAGALSVVAVLAIAAVAAYLLAQAGFRSAEASTARSQALDLASRAQHEEDTVKALALAQQADATLHDTTSAEAVSVATANDTRLRTVLLGSKEYVDAAWAASAPVIVGYSLHQLVAIDVSNGKERSPVEVPDGIQIGTLVVSRDGLSAAYVTRGARALVVVDLATGHVLHCADGPVSAVATGGGDTLWWALDDATLMRNSFFGMPTGQQSARYILPATALAIDVDTDRRLLDFVGNDGRLHTSRWDEATLTDVESIDVTTPDEVAPATRQVPASVTRCGDNLFGGITGQVQLKGTTFSRVDGRLTTKVQYGAILTPTCNTDGTAWYSYLTMGKPSTFDPGVGTPQLPSGSIRYIGVTDPTGKRSAVLTNDGKLYQLSALRTLSWKAEGAIALLRMPSTDYLLTGGGQVVNVDGGAVTGAIARPFLEETLLVLGDDAMIAAAGRLVHIDGAGHPRDALTVRGSVFRHLRAGADGVHFVATLTNAVMLVSPDGMSTTNFSIPGINDGEELADADVSPDGHAIAYLTDAGRVGTVSVDMATSVAAPLKTWQDGLPAGSRNWISYVPATGDLVVASRDGAVRLLNGDMQVHATSFCGAAPEHLMTSGTWAELSSDKGDVVVYDARSLQVRNRVRPSHAAMNPATVRLDAADKRVVGLAVFDPETGKDSVRYEVPLPMLPS